jgi:5-methylcytosine-specific restriction endonuclease McrA
MTNFNRYNWDDKEQLLIDLKKSTSMSNFLKNIGFSSSRGNFSTFRKKIILHNIDLSNIYTVKPQINKLYKRYAWKDSEIFCENSLCDRGYVKKRIKQANLISYKCAGCGNLGSWRGQPITLELEHKNGINNDNRLQNLEYLCPNCHNQTYTYGSKNKHLIFFKRRLSILNAESITSINDSNLESLSILWKIKYSSALDWCKIHKCKLEASGIEVFLKNTQAKNSKNKIEKTIKEIKKGSFSLKDTANKLNLSEEKTLSLIKIYDKTLYLELSTVLIDEKEINKKLKYVQNIAVEGSLDILVKKWGLKKEAVITWLKQYDNKFYLKIMEHEFNAKEQKDLISKITNYADLKENEEIIRASRLQQLSPITNKKQVPTLAKSWNTSINGAKKWIKNNAPEKFAEIYDDALLEKNKVAALKSQKLDYIKSLTTDNFDLNDFIKVYGGNKSGAYSLLSKYNKDLFAHISKTPDCIHCNGKTRTSGTIVKAGETVKRYRCVDCDKSFN